MQDQESYREQPGLALEIVEPYTGETIKLPGDPAAAGAISDPNTAEAFYLLNATKEA